MIEMTAVVKHADGIHLRPATAIVRVAAEYPGEIRMECCKGHTDLRSILDLLVLVIECGTAIKLNVSGPGEDIMCRELASLFAGECFVATG